MSLFGSKPPTQQNGSTGFSFGSTSSAPQTQQQNQNQQPSMNGSMNSAASTLPESNFGGKSTSQTLPSEITPDSSSNKILRDLLDSANNLPKVDNGHLGYIHLPLSELQKRTEKLRSNEKYKGNYTQAHYLLSASGINAADIENELRRIPSATSTSTHMKQDHPESTSLSRVEQNYTKPESIENYLIAKKDESILSAIEQSLAAASKDFDLFINQKIAIDWKVRKEHLKKSLGIPTKSKITNEELAKSFNWNKSLPGSYRVLTPLSTKESSSHTRQISREKFESHAKVVYHLNEARLQNKPFPISLSFEELSKASTDLKSKQMSEVWRIISDLCNEKFIKVIQEQLFLNMYNSSTVDLKLKMRIVGSSRKHLEEQFFNYIDEIYTKEDKKSPELLPPSNINKVTFFIQKVIAMNNDAEYMERTLNINGVPIWALLFYLLRSGLYDEAVELTKVNKSIFEKFDSNFPVYLSSYVRSNCFGLPSDLQERLSSDFSQTFQFLNEDSTNFDPYKYAVYKIIGKCDLAKKSLPSAINLSIEDWLWFHLQLINEFNPEASSSLIFENYTLENLQRKVISIGADKFNASSNNPLYAKTLVMLGLYELAVKYIYDYSNECDAVHLAIGLCYYGLLRVSTSNTDELITLNSEVYEINFSRLLGSYTRTFKISDPKVAAQYLVLICLPMGGQSKKENAKCHEALRELILISREFGPLLGELNQVNGDKVPGILEKQRSLINLPSLDNFYHQIVEVTAKRCEEEGRIFDALRLYQLCQEHNTVVTLINKLLSEVLSMTELDKPLLTRAEYKTPAGEMRPEETIDNNIILLSKHIMKVFANNSNILEKISAKQREIADILLSIVDVREQFVSKDWHATLDSVKKLGLVPIVANDDFVEVRQAAESLTTFDVALVKVVPSLLIIVMTCVSQINHSVMTRKFGVSEAERSESERLKAIAKNCMIYAGMIQYKMPRETYSLLVKLESQL